MRCPACQQTALQDHELEKNLRTLHCKACGGHWIKSFQFWKWRERHRSRHGEASLAAAPGEGEAEEGENDNDSEAGKLCPECGGFLIRKEVGHGVEFHLDRCGHCGGVWLDAHEWDVLKQRGLHLDLPFIFTQAWQASVRREQREAADERWLAARVGEDDAQEAHRIKRWVAQHPERRVLEAYLRHTLSDPTHP